MGFIGEGASEDLVYGIEEVISKGLEPALTALAQLDEVVNEDVRVAGSSLVHPVGGRTVEVRFGFEVHPRVQESKSGGCFHVIQAAVLRSRREVVQGSGKRFQAVWRCHERPGGKGGIGDISYRLRHAAEGRRGLGPTHGAGHGYGYKLGLSFVAGEDDGQARAVRGVEKHSVEAILDVMLGEEGRSMLRVRVSDPSQNPV
jgi:hypothetical protein